nr:RICIN domain-containing protein [uncultured Actinoplanes sp.]
MAPERGVAGSAAGRGEVAEPIDLVGLDFQLVNDNSGKCLADAGAGRDLVQKRCGRGEAYRWRFAPVDVAGAFRVINVGTGECLSGEGGRAVLGPCDDRAERRWRMRDSADPYAQVRNDATGRCLTVAGGSVAEGAPAVQYTCDDQRSRRWTVRVVSLPFLGG